MNDVSCADMIGAARHFCRHRFGAFASSSFNEVEPGRILIDSWHIDHMCHILSEVETGHIRRVIFNVPPRSLKSFLASVAFPAWLLGRDPSRRIMCVSYGDPLACFFGAQTRSIMQAAWYRRKFHETILSSGRPKVNDLHTQAKGYRYAVGMNGAITGRGADFLICDDPMKAQDALSAKAKQKVVDAAAVALWSRLNDRASGAIVLVMQRLHEDDLTGQLERQGGWTVVSLPAVATERGVFRIGPDQRHVHVRQIGDLLQPERESYAELEEQKRILGTYNFEAQYQQRPVPAIGLVVQRAWLRYYDKLPEFYDRCVISWDPASTVGDRSDFSVGTVWMRDGDKMYLIDVLRGKYESPDLQRAIIALAEKWKPERILIENDGIGRGIAQNLRQKRLVTPTPKLVDPDADKAVRFSRHLPLIEEGRLLLPRQAEWLADYEHELLAFPAGAHDDQIDSTTQALDFLVRDEAICRPLERRNPDRRDLTRRNPSRRNLERR